MIIHYKEILLVLAAAILVASCGKAPAPVLEPDPDPIEVEKTAIEVTAEMAEGVISAQTKADAGSYSEGTVTALASGNKFNLALYWNKTTDPTLTSQEVTAAATSPYATGLYWDDFGGYSTDVDMVAACVLDSNLKPTTSTSISYPAASVAKDSRTISWSIASDAYNGSDDLCVSGYLSNLKHTTGARGGLFPTGTFTSAANNELRHVLSRISISLTPGDGYNSSFANGNPSVKIIGLKRKGTVKLVDRLITATSDAAVDLTADAINTAPSTTYDVSFLAVPGVTYTTGNFLEVEVPVANGQKNVYSIPVSIVADLLYYAKDDETVRTAAGLEADKFTLKPGFNYHINLIINKQKILVVAQLLDWNTITSAQTDAPIVFEYDITASGTSTWTSTDNTFDIYRATSDGTYAASLANGSYTTDGCKAYAYDSTEKKWGITTAFYWESSTQQYYFRGLYPSGTLSGTSIVSALSAATYNGKEIYWGTTSEYTRNAMTIGEGYPVYPRTGPVEMKFYPLMSQISVRVITTDDDYKVDLSKEATVSITGTAKTGDINLHVGVIPSSTAADYSLTFHGNEGNPVTAKVYGANEVKKSDNTVIGCFDYVVPQALSDNAKITISLTTSEGPLNYSKSLKSILMQGSATDYITEWKMGGRYIYTLKIKKTGVEVTARLVDWTLNQGDVDVPFM